jgi:hypothetical protein
MICRKLYLDSYARDHELQQGKAVVLPKILPGNLVVFTNAGNFEAL